MREGGQQHSPLYQQHRLIRLLLLHLRNHQQPLTDGRPTPPPSRYREREERGRPLLAVHQVVINQGVRVGGDEEGRGAATVDGTFSPFPPKKRGGKRRKSCTKHRLFICTTPSPFPLPFPIYRWRRQYNPPPANVADADGEGHSRLMAAAAAAAARVSKRAAGGGHSRGNGARDQ